MNCEYQMYNNVFIYITNNFLFMYLKFQLSADLEVMVTVFPPVTVIMVTPVTRQMDTVNVAVRSTLTPGLGELHSVDLDVR